MREGITINTNHWFRTMFLWAALLIMAGINSISAQPLETLLISNPKADFHPAWSSDGGLILFASDREGNLDVWAADRDGSNPLPITRSAGSIFCDQPAWNPMARRLCYVSNRSGNLDLWLTSLHASDRPLSPSLGRDQMPRWSPDGKKILFVSDRFGPDSIWVANVETGKAYLLVGDATEPDWSPDGEKIVFSAQR